MQEIMTALDRIIHFTAGYLLQINDECMEGTETREEVYKRAKDFLHQNPDADFTYFDAVCQKSMVQLLQNL